MKDNYATLNYMTLKYRALKYMTGIVAVYAVFTFIFSTFVNAQQLQDVTEIAQSAVKEGAQSQDRVDRLDDEIDQLTREYKAALIQLRQLREYNALRERLITEQEDKMVDIRAQIEKATNIDREIVPHMFAMIDALEQFVALDVPFLIEERKARVTRLKELMENADVSQSERYRKILEAYEIENEYGRTIEVYEDLREVDGEDRTVTYLRIGRVAFIYQTLDGEESGVWSQDERAFVDLDGDFDSEIRKALRIAKQQAAPDLMVVPVMVKE